MNRINLLKVLIFFFSFSFAFKVYSQNNFAYRASLDEIKETGFYKIDLPPQVVAKCRRGLPDIRIFNDDGKQVPYILKNDLPSYKKENVTEFPIIKNAKESDKLTHVVLENITNKPVNKLLLFIKNTDAHRGFSVSGSDDSTHWFIIKENIYLDNSFNGEDENIAQILSFPPGNYKYFQLTILGENLLPFNIVRAGVYKKDFVYGKYVAIPAPSVIQKDSSNKKSYIHLKFDDSYQINKMVIDIEGAKYFKRSLTILANNKTSSQLLINNYLNSDSLNFFIIDTKTNEVLIIIDNEDNMPLNVKDIKAFQLNISLFAYLSAGQKYSLNFGNSNLAPPKYDLTFFSDSIKNSSEIFIKNIEKSKEPIKFKKTSVFNNQLLLWTTIGAGLFILCFVTFKMMKEVNKKSTNG